MSDENDEITFETDEQAYDALETVRGDLQWAYDHDSTLDPERAGEMARIIGAASLAL